LFVENTTRHGGSFINFRPDYGARWDGRIRLRGCTLRPNGGQRVSVLSYRPSNFDYQYPIGFARSIVIDDLVIDYSAAHKSDSPCWLMEIAPFSKTDQGARLFFPQRIEFRNIVVEGREQGVRLIRIPDPRHYDLRRGGGYDESRLTPNCTLVCDNVQLEKLAPENVEDAREAHLSIGGETALDVADSLALYPRVRFTDCDYVSVYLGNCIASVFFERCTVNTVTAPSLQGELVFNDCRLQPSVRQAPAGSFYQVASTLGTRFTNCTIHAPVVNGKAAPEMVDRIAFAPGALPNTGVLPGPPMRTLHRQRRSALVHSSARGHQPKGLPAGWPALRRNGTCRRPIREAPPARCRQPLPPRGLASNPSAGPKGQSRA
jgi:hypothetical protein